MLRPFNHSDLKLLHLGISAQTESPVVWNSFPGSVLHGALGFHLKRLSCVVSHGRCGDCFLNHDCAYGILFEPRPPEGTARMRKYDRIPSPLRISLHPWQGTRLEAGQSVEITLVLIGRGAERAVPLLLALKDAMQEGLGRKSREGARGRLVIQHIADAESGEKITWDNFDPSQRLPFRPLRWDELASLPPPFRIQFRTPVRIVAGGKVQSHPGFRSFLSTLMRRITSLAYFSAGVEIEADFAGMLARAELLAVQSDFKRVPVHRYSSRQKTEMTLDGVLGTMVIPAGGEEFLPWILVGQRVGVGKNTGMGFGEYALD